MMTAVMRACKCNSNQGASSWNMYGQICPGNGLGIMRNFAFYALNDEQNI